MPYLNDASAKYRMVNCSLCAVGGVLGMASSRVATAVIARLGARTLRDPSYQGDQMFIALALTLKLVIPPAARPDMYKQLQQQLYGIKAFLSDAGKKTSFVGSRIGAPKHRG